MRARLLQLIRSLGLAHALDRARYWWSARRYSKANASFRQQNPNFALPPDYLMYESYKIDYAAYHRSGQEGAQWIKDSTAPHQSLPDQEGNVQTELKSDLRILDWGCGPGRVIRHLPAIFGPEGYYSGCDPNTRSINWCQSALPNIDFQESGLMPPLPYAENSFDLLYGISIFTHLSAAAHQAWIEELTRVLAPDGLALLTTHGPIYQQKLTPAEQAIYQRDEIVVRGKVQEGHRVFTAFQPPAYWRTLVAPHLEIAAYQAGQAKDWGLEQDSWVLRKK